MLLKVLRRLLRKTQGLRIRVSERGAERHDIAKADLLVRCGMCIKMVLRT